MKKYEVTMYGGEGEILFQKIYEANSKGVARKMSEKEVVAASNNVFIEAKKFKNGITLREIREATGLPKSIVGV